MLSFTVSVHSPDILERYNESITIFVEKSQFYAELECLSKLSTTEATTLFKSNLADLMVLQLNQDFGENVEKLNDQSLQLFNKIFVVLDDMGRKVNDRFSGVAAILEESLNILMHAIPIKQFAKVTYCTSDSFGLK